MAHERKDIRTAIVARLIAADVAGPRVSTSRERPVRKGGLPAVLVFSDSEKVIEGSEQTAPRELKRVAVFAIEAWVTAEATELEDAMDAIALEVEAVMDADLNLSHPDDVTNVPTAFDSGLIGTEFGVDPNGETPMGCVRLEYAITYHSQQRDAEVPEDVFDTAGITHDLAGAQDAAEQRSDLVENINQE